jgi:hypothetical protein
MIKGFARVGERVAPVHERVDTDGPTREQIEGGGKGAAA